MEALLCRKQLDRGSANYLKGGNPFMKEHLRSVSASTRLLREHYVETGQLTRLRLNGNVLRTALSRRLGQTIASRGKSELSERAVLLGTDVLVIALDKLVQTHGTANAYELFDKWLEIHFMAAAEVQSETGIAPVRNVLGTDEWVLPGKKVILHALSTAVASDCEDNPDHALLSYFSLITQYGLCVWEHIDKVSQMQDSILAHQTRV